ncbi:hypothetical protein [Sphingobium sp. BS19]|uniref:hypothetical protein n=1 Tax=Sphingobium sp. BS19 TaxID=3018973 RepID=UPI0024934BD3|nr:hypothetical protein [Sphingobium sp. BS19]
MGEFTIGERGQIMSGARTVAQMIITNHNRKQMMAERDLFLAAPDLLAALQGLLNALDSCVDLTPEVIRKAETAVAKALGQEAGK